MSARVQAKGRETYQIIQAMKATGNRTGIIAQWKEMVEQWVALNCDSPGAAAVRAWLPLWQARPFYTAEELAPMWPALGIVTGVLKSWPSVPKSAKRLEHELDFYELPRLPEPYRNYFICERLHYWKRAPLSEIKMALAT